MLRPIFLALALLIPLPAWSDTPPDAEAPRPQTECPLPETPIVMTDAALANSPTDCCAGQKGLCGCRAGKIVCCDGKPSKLPTCSCRGDEPEFSP